MIIQMKDTVFEKMKTIYKVKNYSKSGLNNCPLASKVKIVLPKRFWERFFFQKDSERSNSYRSYQRIFNYIKKINCWQNFCYFLSKQNVDFNKKKFLTSGLVDGIIFCDSKSIRIFIIAFKNINIQDYI